MGLYKSVSFEGLLASPSLTRRVSIKKKTAWEGRPTGSDLASCSVVATAVITGAGGGSLQQWVTVFDRGFASRDQVLKSFAAVGDFRILEGAETSTGWNQVT